LDLFLVD